MTVRSDEHHGTWWNRFGPVRSYL